MDSPPQQVMPDDKGYARMRKVNTQKSNKDADPWEDSSLGAVLEHDDKKVAGYEVAECSPSCVCGHALTGIIAPWAFCTSFCCYDCRDLPYAKDVWNRPYYSLLETIRATISNQPKGNTYIVQWVSSLAFPRCCLPAVVEASDVHNEDIHGEWLVNHADTVDDSGYTVLWFHGGAYIMMSAHSEHLLPSTLMVSIRAAQTFTADYPRPPYHEFCDTVEEAVVTYTWLLEQVPAEKIIVAGESSGGGLATQLLLQIEERGLAMPRAALLISPWIKFDVFDDPSWEENNETDYIHGEIDHKIARAFITRGEDPQQSKFAAFYASPQQLGKFPPMWISVGGGEVLKTSIEGFAQKVENAGVSVHLYEGEGMSHVYQMFAQCASLPPDADLLPSVCCCQSCCNLTHPPNHPMWESFEDARAWVEEL